MKIGRYDLGTDFLPFFLITSNNEKNSTSTKLFGCFKQL